MDNAHVYKALETLLTEIYISPPNPKETWAVSNEPNSGLLGTLDHLSPSQASRSSGDSHSIASHARHALFAVDSGLRYAAGDFSPRNWEKSWGDHHVDAAAWDALRSELKTKVKALLDLAKTPEACSDDKTLTGIFGLVAHGAYHLGVIRHLAGQVRTL